MLDCKTRPRRWAPLLEQHYGQAVLLDIPWLLPTSLLTG
jgi:hypothetical protein